jgi:LysM repeat protein
MTRLKGFVGIVVAEVAIAALAALVALAALAILAGLPGIAEAQEEEAEPRDTGTTSVEATQNTTTTDEKGAPTATAAWRRSALEPSTTTPLVVESGDSLWSISEEQIGPGATPEQIAYEVERIYEVNRERIGEDPNLIFPGQQILVARGTEAATETSSTAGLTTTTPDEPTAGQTSNETKDEPVADSSSRAKEDAEPSNPSFQEYAEREGPSALTVLISLAYFLFTLGVAALAVFKLLTRRRLLRERYGASQESSVRQDRSAAYYANYDEARSPERQADAPAAHAAAHAAADAAADAADAPAATSTRTQERPGQERLNRVRHLRRIRQRPSPRTWWGGQR